MPIRRRELVHALAALGLLGACRPRARADLASDPGPPVDGEDPVDATSFRHGVASGDPGADRVVLWTRVEPRGSGPDQIEPIAYVVARDPALREVVAVGEVTTSADRDFTVKIDVGGLAPDTTYYYRFARARSATEPPSVAQASPIGRTRTLPVGAVERVRLGFCSCANYPAGFFNAYAALAQREDLALVLHLGDYLYEYADGRYGDGRAIGRPVEPDGETVSLADYRARHALYKRDPDLQAVHAAHPFVAVWDDHELANDTWSGGAQNHDVTSQGDWPARMAAAIRAYYEWMSIRGVEPGASPVLYRRLRFGELADVMMLDTRVVGRDRQVGPDDPPGTREDPRRSLLGDEQEAWLFAALLDSAHAGVAWRLLGQQVVMASLRFDPSKPPHPDSWDGYPAARARLLGHLREHAIADVVVLSGDIHSSWALEVGEDPWSADPAQQAPALVELVTPAISSPGPVPAERADELAREFSERHPHLRWVELKTRGYVTLDITAERVQADWWFVDTVRERRADVRFANAFVVERGAARLREGSGPA